MFVSRQGNHGVVFPTHFSDIRARLACKVSYRQSAKTEDATVERLAADILGARYWFFWWD
jgi:hypothetical protein